MGCTPELYISKDAKVGIELGTNVQRKDSQRMNSKFAQVDLTMRQEVGSFKPEPVIGTRTVSEGLIVPAGSIRAGEAGESGGGGGFAEEALGGSEAGLPGLDFGVGDGDGVAAGLS